MSEVERLRKVLALVGKAEAAWHVIQFNPEADTKAARRRAESLDFDSASAALEFCRTDAPALLARLEACEARVVELESLINSPHNADWFEGVRIEAAHQVERWGVDHDSGKQPPDWFWLLGYLGGKALASACKGDIEKAKHHTISSGAALLNWHRALTGESNAMRPGIDSTGVADAEAT